VGYVGSSRAGTESNAYFDRKTLKVRDYLAYLEVGGKIILIYM
jgi:hypothetical protein